MSKVTSDETLTDLNLLTSQGSITWKARFSMNCSIVDSEFVKLLKELLDEGEEGESTKEKGDRLEAVGKYIFDNCGFFENPKHDIKNSQHQLDHVADCSSLVFDYLKSKSVSHTGILGESKNYPTKKLDVNVVYKMESLKLFTQSGLGVYFTRVGLTGNELAAAQTLVKDFYNRYNRISVVFTDVDWRFLSENPKKVPCLFYEKINKFVTSFSFDLTQEEYQSL